MKARKIKPIGNKFSGFSLLETTVAVGILVMAILGPLSLASTSIRSSSVAKNNLIAAGLAQEGLELFRNKRASNVLQSQDWMLGLTGAGGCFNANGCTIDALTLVVNNCTPTCPFLNFDNTSGLFSYGAGAPSPFRRTIMATYITENGFNEVKVKSTIEWNQLFGDEKFELEEYILNW